MTGITNISECSKKLFTPEETAGKLRVSKGTLAVWRCTGRYNLVFIKVGRNIRYTGEAIDNFLERRTVSPEHGA